MKNTFKTLLALAAALLLICLNLSADEKKDYYELGWELVENESLGELKFGRQLSEVAKLLGEPSETITYGVLWADAEYHQGFKYQEKGIEIDVILGEEDWDKTINMITITAPCTYKTKKGIGIGSSYEEVVEAYKDYIEPGFSDHTSATAGTVYGGIIFNLEDNKVNLIFIGAAAE